MASVELSEHFTETLKSKVKAESLPVRFDEEKDLDWHLDKGRQRVTYVGQSDFAELAMELKLNWDFRCGEYEQLWRVNE